MAQEYQQNAKRQGVIKMEDMIVKVKYFNKNIDKLEKISKGDLIDLRAAETVEFKAGEAKKVRLGIGMQMPKGYEAHVYPRSSTFKEWGVLLTNSVGIIDNSYCGDNDEWCAMFYATRPVTIYENQRIAQFRLVKNMEQLSFEEVEHLDNKSRGGYGSTGAN